ACGPAREDGHALDLLGPVGEDERHAIELFLHERGKVAHRDRCHELPAEAPGREPLLGLDAELRSEQGVVADLRVRVEGEMVGGQRQVVIEERLQAAAEDAVDDAGVLVPEEAVVGDHKLRSGLAGTGEEVARGGDAAGDLGDVLPAEHLNAHGPGARIGLELEVLGGISQDLVARNHSANLFEPRGVAQPGSARRSGRRGPRFKSGHPDTYETIPVAMRRARRTGLALLSLVALSLAAPSAASAHAVSGIDYRFPLPVWLFALAAGVAVLASAPPAMLPVRSNTSWVGGDFYGSIRLLHLGTIGLVVFTLALIDVLVGGLFGPKDFFENPATIVVWVDFWVGLGIVTALVGNAWDFVSPLSAAGRALERALAFRRSEE